MRACCVRVMLTLYDMDRMTEQRADAFLDRLEQAFRRF
jgi:hypothetical protein